MNYQGLLVGSAVRQTRKDRNITVDEVAEQSGLSTSTINKMEQGMRKMTIDTLLRLTEIFDCDANTLLGMGNVKDTDTIDYKLSCLPSDKRDYLEKTFTFMIEQAA